MNLNRRKLISWLGLGWLTSFFPSTLTGCSDEKSPIASSPIAPPETLAATPSNNFKAIGAIAQLDKDGQLVADKVGVVRDPQKPSSLLAVNLTCTHQGCAVQWKSDQKQYVCPCHGAKFAANGAVLEGPAKKSLPRYAAKIEKGQVLVSS